jgi:surface polysaccharide O-acyltransferase-like enzyme
MEIQSEKSLSLPPKERVLYLDVLRILACFAVVVIHSAGMIYEPGAIGANVWLVGVILNSLSRWCVPIFFMISGLNLLSYRERYSTKTFLSKRFFRVVVPFIFWAIFYFIWAWSIGDLKISNFVDGVNNLIGGPPVYHLWFFYAYIGVCLVTPFLTPLTKKENRSYLVWLIAICIFANQIVPLFSKFLGISFGFEIPLASAYLDYYLLGWWLKDKEFPPKIKWLIFSGGILGILVTIFGSYWLCIQKGTTDFYFMDYEALTTLAAALMVFTGIKQLNWEKIINNQGVRSVVRNLADCSFGIYLVHILIQHYVIQIFSFTWASMLFMLVSPFIVFPLSWAVVAGLKKIPIMRMALP